jgi:hypothetical protein
MECLCAKRGDNADEYTLVGGGTVLRAILTDSHLWLPLLVLVAGIVLLLRLV